MSIVADVHPRDGMKEREVRLSQGRLAGGGLSVGL